MKRYFFKNQLKWERKIKLIKRRIKQFFCRHKKTTPIVDWRYSADMCTRCGKYLNFEKF